MLWVEKYRPQRIADCVLPSMAKKAFAQMIKDNEIQNLLFESSSPGTGKTTVALAICKELDADYLLINASEDGNIDTLRGKIRQFASTTSITNNHTKKIVILDEADYLTAAVQPALRGFIEEFHNNCRFILTCNYKNRIIEALQSRCSTFDFSIPLKEKGKLATAFFLRLQDILKKENASFDEKAAAKIVFDNFPDFRKIINTCQKLSQSGQIDTKAITLSSTHDDMQSKIFSYLKEKDFSAIRKWIGNHSDIAPNVIYRLIYDHMLDYVKADSVPNLVLILANYQYQQAFVVDNEINLVAAMVEIMGSVEFK